MEWAGAVFDEGAAVFGCGIAFVRSETVLGVEHVEFAHEGVTMDLGDDRGGGDGERERVAVEDAGLGAGMIDAHGVNEQVVGCDAEALDGDEHGEAGGLVDVEAIDGLGVDFGDRKGDGNLADLAIEALALLAGELLGVFETHAGEDSDLRRENHGGGDDGAEERTATDFVDAGDDAVAVVAQGLLRRVGADELLEHLLLGGGFGDAVDGRNVEEQGHRYASEGRTFECSG